MAIFMYRDKEPAIGESCYIADSAEVIGDVEMGWGCYIGSGAILRGDYGSIIIGDETAIEEGSVIHARPGEICTIGSSVTIGHGAIVHNAKNIDDFSIIGMGAVVSDYASVGEWAVVGEGAVVANGQVIPPGKIAVGVPAKIVGDVSNEYKDKWKQFKRIYVELAATYRENLKRL